MEITSQLWDSHNTVFVKCVMCKKIHMFIYIFNITYQGRRFAFDIGGGINPNSRMYLKDYMPQTLNI